MDKTALFDYYVLMVTIEDVAKEAGVSIGTVSNVLNNLPSVRESNREKVRKAIAKLNYHVNGAARMLRINASGFVGLIIPNVENPFFGEYARSVERTLRSLGYNVFLCNTERNYNTEKEYIENLLEIGILGIIIGRSTLSIEELNEVNRHCPVAVSDQNNMTGVEFYCININTRPGIKTAVNRIVGYGHKKIAYIDGLFSMRIAEEIRTELKENDIEIPKEYHRKGNYEWESGYSECINLLRLDDPPTAIICANDFMALGAMKAIHERGLKIPQDISIIGYDNILFSKMSFPTLSTINNPASFIGETLARKIVDKIEGTESIKAQNEVIIQSEFIERDSLGQVKK